MNQSILCTMKLVFRRLAIFFLFVSLSACAQPLAIVGVGASAIEQETPGVTKHEIFFSTTRARSADDKEFFGGGRKHGLTNGKITIGIPPAHQTGKIELAKTEDAHDPQKHFSVAEPLLYDGTKTFVNRLQAELSRRAPKDRNVLIFVHGYNTSFSNAVTRVTQFVHDTGFDGVPVLFTWASRARTVEYVYDINSALQARFHMAELALAMQNLNINEYSILAHSMGNLATLETLVVLNSMPEFNPRGRLKAIMLAAPDVDFDLFQEHITALERVNDKIYVLISHDDKALGASRLIAGGIDRAGAADSERLAKLGITVVDLSNVNDKSRADHSKYADSPAIVQLIGNSINAGNTLSAQTEDSGVESVVGGIFRRFSLTGGGGSILVLGN